MNKLPENTNIIKLTWEAKLHNLFHILATKTSQWMGSSWAFGLAIITIIIWLMVGPLFKFSDSWQLVVNTATTIITFLVVFLIQHSQNKDSHALHLKIDELIRAHKAAHNQYMGIEHLTDTQIDELHRQIEAKIKAKKEKKEKKVKPLDPQ